MTPEMIRALLGWSTLINLLFYLLWIAIFAFAHDFVYGIHNQLFSISAEMFNAIHYAGIIFYKLLIVFFNLIPYLIMRIKQY